MSEDADQLVGPSFMVQKTPIRRENNRSNNEENVPKMKVAFVVPDCGFESPPQRCSKLPISLMEFALLRSRGGEHCNLSTKPLWENKSACHGN